MSTFDAEATVWCNAGKWSLGFVLFCSLIATMGALALFQASAEGPAKRTHVRAVAALTEVDTLIERNYDDLQERAQASQPGDTVELRDYLIDVPLTREEVLGASKTNIRDMLLARSADILYAHGTGPLRESEGAHRVGRFTAAGAVDRSLDLLQNDVHAIVAIVLVVLAAVSALLAVTLAALSRGFGRLGSVGAVLLFAALPMMLAGVGARFYMRIASNTDTEYLRRELLDIGAGMAWITIRDGLVLAALGAAFVVAAIVLDRAAPRPDEITRRAHAAP